MKSDIRFVTREEFQTIIHAIKGAPEGEFPWWFRPVLETLWATGCRPSEIVGHKGRLGREPEEGGPRVSRVKAHHGLRSRDVLPNSRLFIEGKRTTPKRRTEELKARIVLCADNSIYRELRELSIDRASDPQANLFVPHLTDPAQAVKKNINKLRKRIPEHLRGFTPRWLRHSHAIAAIRAGVDLVSVQRQLGHESLRTTATYLRFAGLDESRYLEAFGMQSAALEERDCPSCGFQWRVDPSTGAMDLSARMGVAFRRR